MADVFKITSGDVKKTGGVYATGKTPAVVDDRVYDTQTLLEEGAQNAGGNVPPGPSFGVVASGCLSGYGTNASPIYIKINPSGGISCDANGLCVDTSGSATVDNYFYDETDNGNSGASKTISFALKANQKLTLTANCTLTFTPPVSARSTKMHFVQGGSGGYSVTLPSGTSGSLPSIASGLGDSTIVNFYYDAGGVWHV